MSKQPHRLDPTTSRRFAGGAIDRNTPLRFRLNGQTISGFEGDTVLSAVLASGVIAVGQHSGGPLALDDRFAPKISPRTHRQNVLHSLPMARTPAVDGLDLVTLGPREAQALSTRLVGSVSPWHRNGLRTLGHRFDTPKALDSPWEDFVPQHSLTTDLVVVGAGIAGLSAAIAAAQKGDSVIVVERRPWPGGDVRFFGSVDGEESPETIIATLNERVLDLPNITLMTGTEAFALFDKAVRVHRVQRDGKAVQGSVVSISSPRIVLATGSLERLPVFAGNRLPGVTGAICAFHLADRYSVWPGKTAIFTTTASEPYRLAMLAQDAGLSVRRVADNRLRPQSRFIEFSKAYGIPLAPGLMPTKAAAAPARQQGIEVTFALTVDEASGVPASMVADRLIACGGWQADLTLWHMAGGSSTWMPDPARLVAEGELDGVMLAGSVAGLVTNRGCMRSGQAAAARLFGRTSPRVDDIGIDPIYESPPASTSIAPWDGEHEQPIYLDTGTSLTQRTPPVSRVRLALWPFGPSRRRWPLADQARALSIGDVAAGVQIGAVPESDAGVVAQERSVAAGDLIDRGLQSTDPEPDAQSSNLIPHFLTRRFGPEQVVALLSAEDGRALQPGSLIYGTSDIAGPAAAIGAILSATPGGRTSSRVLIGRAPRAEGERVWVKDVSQIVAARLMPDPSNPPALTQPGA